MVSTFNTRVRRVPRTEVRKRLVEAAATVFAQKGFNGASIEEVAETAGFSKGAVYSNFSGKEELFLALVTQRIQASLIAIEETVSRSGGTPEDAWENAASALASILERDPHWHVLFLEFWLFAMRHPAAHRLLAEHRKQARAAIAAALERQSRGIEKGLAIPRDAFAAILFALFNGLAIEHLIDPSATPAAWLRDALKGLMR